MIITSEYIYNNIQLNETSNIVENTVPEHEQKHGGYYRKIVKVWCVAEFLDKMKNETKIITIECYNIIGELNKVMQSSRGRIKFIRIIELKIIIKRRIKEIVLDLYLECENNPILQKKLFMKIVNSRQQRFIQNYRVRHFCNFNENNIT